jgi:hypothetical protein
MKEIRKKLEKYDLFYGSFGLFSQTDYHRDFLLYLCTSDFVKIRIKLTGVVAMNYNSRIIEDNFNINEKYLNEDLGPPYHGFHWGIKAFEISDWKIEDDTSDLKTIQENYNFKLYKINFQVSSADVSFIFNDLIVEEI